jgi:PAS domain S-box-containing protein
LGYPKSGGRPWVVNLFYGAVASIVSSVSFLAGGAGTLRRILPGRDQRLPLSAEAALEPEPAAAVRHASSTASGPEGRSIASRLLRLSRSYRRAEQARSKLAAIVESSSDAIIGKSLNGTISSWNRGASSLFGYRPEEVLGKPISLLAPPAQKDEFRGVLNRIGRGERIDRGETLWLRKDGNSVHVSISVSPIKDVWGRIVGAATIARDISDQVRIQEDQRFLLEVDRMLASSLDPDTILSGVADLAVGHLADGCAVDLVGEDGKLRQAAVVTRNPEKEPAARELHRRGYLRAGERYCMPSVVRDGVPQLHTDLSEARPELAPEDREHLDKLLLLGVRSAMVLPMVARGRTIGAIAFVSGEGGRRYNQSDLVLAEDLAHRVALVLDNVRLFQDAQRAILVRDEFLSVAAHEFRTPVTSLHGFAQFALRQIDKGEAVDPQKIRQGLEVISYQSKKLAHLVSQLLSVSAMEAGNLTVDRQLVDLTRLVEGVVAMARTGTSDHSIVVHTPPSMPIIADPFRLEQVVINLLDNAIKYSPDGGLIEVDLSAPSPGSTRLTVRDHGTGVPSDQLERVFDRLYRGHDAHNFSGMGLGLYVSREVIRLHGGEIWLESPQDGGTLCVVTLPTGLYAMDGIQQDVA